MPIGNVTKDRGKVRTVVDKTKSTNHVAFGYMQGAPVEFIKTDLGYYWAFLDSPNDSSGNKAGRFLSKDLDAAKTYVKVKGGMWVDDLDLSGFEGAIVNVKAFVDQLLTEVEVIADDLQGCVDCLLYVANGDIPEDRPNLPQEIAARWPTGHVVDASPEECEGHFSSRQCDICGSRLGGDRYPFAVLSS